MVTNITGDVKVNQGRKRATLKFSSDGIPRATYKCKINKRKFKNCELIVYCIKFDDRFDTSFMYSIIIITSLQLNMLKHCRECFT